MGWLPGGLPSIRVVWEHETIGPSTSRSALQVRGTVPMPASGRTDRPIGRFASDVHRALDTCLPMQKKVRRTRVRRTFPVLPAGPVAGAGVGTDVPGQLALSTLNRPHMPVFTNIDGPSRYIQ